MTPTAADLLRAAVPQLRRAGVQDAARDARLLLAHALCLSADRLTLHLTDQVSAGQQDSFQQLLHARLARQPISQIVGQRLFWGRAFRVTPDVLDPRPETETLVAAALQAPFATLLDLGTGSGAILLSLLAERQTSTGTGTDRSLPALDVARVNAQNLGVASRAAFLASDWFQKVAGRVDLIVSNPPYISEQEMADLAPEVRDHEPRIALTPGGDGLDAYRAIAAGAVAHLLPGGRILVEIGPTQGAAVCDLFRAGGLRDLEVLPDLDGRDRVVGARAPGP